MGRAPLEGTVVMVVLALMAMEGEGWVTGAEAVTAVTGGTVAGVDVDAAPATGLQAMGLGTGTVAVGGAGGAAGGRSREAIVRPFKI